MIKANICTAYNYLKSLIFLIFLTVNSVSNLLFWGIRFARVSLLFVWEGVYRDLLELNKYPILENSRSGPADPAHKYWITLVRIDNHPQGGRWRGIWRARKVFHFVETLNTICEKLEIESHYGIGFTPQHWKIVTKLCIHYCMAFSQAWGILNFAIGIQLHWCMFKNSVHIPSTDPYTYNGIHKFAIRTRYANRILKIAFRPLILRILFSQNEPVHITFTQVIFRNHPLSVMTFYPELRA